MPDRNIFLFVMDTARAKNVSCYGYERNTTPFLDQLAEEGIKFNKAYANAPWTLPSHTSMFTGKYPHEHGKLSKEDDEDIWCETVQEKLSDKGYRTLGVSSNGWISSAFGFDEIFDEFVFNSGQKLLFERDELMKELMEGEEENRWKSTLDKYSYFLKESIMRFRPLSLLNGAHYFYKYKIRSEEQSDAKWEDDGAEFTYELLKGKNFDTDQPSFVFVNFTEPHHPYMPPRKFAEKYYNGDISEVEEEIKKYPYKNLGQENEELAQKYIDFYDAELNYIDHMLEKIISDIEDRTERENVFIIVGDHGEMFGENNQKLWEHHGGLTEEVLRVPMIISGIDNREVEELVELKDLFDIIPEIALKGSMREIGRKEAYADYLGIQSQIFKKEFEDYDIPIVGEIKDEGIKTFEDLNELEEGKIKGHLRELRIQKQRR